MKTLKIEKFIDEQLETTVQVPFAFVDVLSTILPASGVTELQKHGIDLPALTRAVRDGTIYAQTIEAKEGGVRKKIVISIG